MKANKNAESFPTYRILAFETKELFLGFGRGAQVGEDSFLEVNLRRKRRR